MLLVIVTGMSGAGKSQALNKLEDMGFFCVDNLPAALIVNFAQLCLSKSEFVTRAAIGVDCREEMSFEQIYDKIDELKRIGIHPEILFLDAPDEVLIKRYKETRRNHPLSREGFVEAGIANERIAMKQLSEMSDYIINTGGLRPIDLFMEIEKNFGSSSNTTVFIKSFGFKNGIPLDADFVFDVRFLPNPYWEEELRHLSGLDKQVIEYVLADEAAKSFLKDICGMIKNVLPGFISGNKKQIVIAIGCTGGRHRSVCIAALFSQMLTETNVDIKLLHRDLHIDPAGKLS